MLIDAVMGIFLSMVTMSPKKQKQQHLPAINCRGKKRLCNHKVYACIGTAIRVLNVKGSTNINGNPIFGRQAQKGAESVCAVSSNSVVSNVNHSWLTKMILSYLSDRRTSHKGPSYVRPSE